MFVVALAVIVPVFLTGCAAVYYPDPTAALVDQGRGTYHMVAKGETLWMIAQRYQVDMDQVVLLNNIKDASDIHSGQKIFIPGGRSDMRQSIPRAETSHRQTARASAVQENFCVEEFSWPLRGEIISSFQNRNAGFWDQGIRFKAPSGSQVSATRPGKVIFADDLLGYGQTVILDHMDGFMSVYAGNVQPIVGLGDTVSNENAVAIFPSGDGAFLYFEIRRHGEAVNPLFYLPKR